MAALLLGMAFSVLPGAVTPASAAAAFEQCNGINNQGGQLITCSVVVTNTLDLTTGVGSAVAVSVMCQGPANIPNPTCTTDSQPFTEVITSINQCNSAVNGGGANVTCDVRVVNNITGNATTSPATVNQCNGSGAEGTAPTLDCNPSDASTTGATITQCNGSANGGGAPDRVECDVLPSTETSALVVLVNQCNGAANGGGSTVDCSAQLTNTITPAAVTPIAPIAPVPDTLAATGGADPRLAAGAGFLVLLGAVLILATRKARLTV